jgi:hypothetical protein
VQQRVDIETHDSVHNEYRNVKTFDSLLMVKLHYDNELTVIHETFIPIRDASGQVTGSVLSERIRIDSHNEKDSTAVYHHSTNEETQQQASAISDTRIEIENKEERKTSTGSPWMFFAYLVVIIVLFADKLKNLIQS